MGFYSATILIYFVCFQSQAAQISGSDNLTSKSHNSESQLLLSLSSWVSFVFPCFMLMWGKHSRLTPPAASFIKKMCFFFSLCAHTTVQKNKFCLTCHQTEALKPALQQQAEVIMGFIFYWSNQGFCIIYTQFVFMFWLAVLESVQLVQTENNSETFAWLSSTTLGKALHYTTLHHRDSTRKAFSLWQKTSLPVLLSAHPSPRPATETINSVTQTPGGQRPPEPQVRSFVSTRAGKGHSQTLLQAVCVCVFQLQGWFKLSTSLPRARWAL